MNSMSTKRLGILSEDSLSQGLARVTTKIGFRGTVEERFWAKVNKDGPVSAVRPDLGKCWLWTGAKAYKGYGSFYFQGRTAGVHRVSYTLFIGEIPEDLVIDHLCRIHSCVNPAHLEAVTGRENLLRGKKGCLRIEKSHCINGHIFDEENTGYILHLNGSVNRRYCRPCKRLAYKRWYEKEYSRQKMEELCV